MKRLNTTTTIIKIGFLVLIVTGCGKSYEKEGVAAGYVTKQIHASHGKVSFVDYSDTDNRKRKSIVLTFGEIKNIPNDYNREKITSTAALMYLKQLDQADYKDYDDIKVILESSPKNYEIIYSINEMSSVESILASVQKFIDATNEDDFEKCREIVDSKRVSDSTLLTTTVFIKSIDSTYGKVKNTNYSGFHFDHLTENNDPVLVSWIQTTHDTEKTYFKFIISRTSKMIIYIGVNESI
jgi:hypothetical protein